MRSMLRVLAWAVVALGVSGCAKMYVITHPLAAPLAQPVTIAIGEIGDELPADLAAKKPRPEDFQKLRLRLIEAIAGCKSVQVVEAGDQALYEVQGSFLEYARGSGAARFFIGFGVGNARVTLGLRLLERASGATLFAGNFKGEVASWAESGDAMFRQVASDFAKELAKQLEAKPPTLIADRGGAAASASLATLAMATMRMDVSVFYRELEPYGEWFEHGSYGWVWTPYDVAYGWRPYTDGRWAYTEYGWTWVSYEPWGWAPFHYGRWFFDPGFGWVWVPGTVWAPAWVCWRWNDEWIGWAPLPPDVEWHVGVGLRYQDPEFHRVLTPPVWSFVRRRWLAERNIRHKLESAPRNAWLVRETRISYDYDELDRRPRNRGLDVHEFERSVARPLPRVRVVDAVSSRLGDRPAKGGAIQVFRPDIAPPAEQPPTVTPRRAPPLPEPKLREVEAKEQRRFESFFERQQRHIESAQRKEVRRAPPGTDEQELRRRHEQERAALEEQKARERKVIEQRIEKRIVKPDRKQTSKEAAGSR